MVIISNGCSHTMGGCRNSYDDSYSNIVAKSLINRDVETLHSPTHNIEYKEEIEKTLKSDNIHIGLADYGKSNDMIFYETYNILHSFKKKNIKIDFVIVQWSGPNRRLHSTHSGGLITVNPHENFRFGIKFDPYASLSTIHYMKTLQDYLKTEDISYVFIPYMELDKNVFNGSDVANFLDLERFTTHPTDGHRNEFRKNGWVCDEQGHPSLLGNYILTSKCLDVFGVGDSIMGFYEYYNSTKQKVSPLLGSHTQNHKKIKENAFKLGDATKNEIKRLKKFFN